MKWRAIDDEDFSGQASKQMKWNFKLWSMKIKNKTRNFHSIAVSCQTAAVSFRSVSGNGGRAGKLSAYSHQNRKRLGQCGKGAVFILSFSFDRGMRSLVTEPLSPHVSLSQHTIYTEKSRNASTNPPTNLSLQMTSANMLTH